MALGSRDCRVDRPGGVSVPVRGPGYEAGPAGASTCPRPTTRPSPIAMLRREGPRRRRLASEQALLETAAAGPGPDEEAWRRLRAEKTREALRSLPAEQREVLL